MFTPLLPSSALYALLPLKSSNSNGIQHSTNNAAQRRLRRRLRMVAKFFPDAEIQHFDNASSKCGKVLRSPLHNMLHTHMLRSVVTYIQCVYEKVNKMMLARLFALRPHVLKQHCSRSEACYSRAPPAAGARCGTQAKNNSTNVYCTVNQAPLAPGAHNKAPSAPHRLFTCMLHTHMSARTPTPCWKIGRSLCNPHTTHTHSAVRQQHVDGRHDT